MTRALFAIVFAAVSSAATVCPGPHDVAGGDSLNDLAGRYLGDSRYAISIALATNARTGDGFNYIANPDDLSGIHKVCIPSKAEARLLRRRWDAYDKAVSIARLPRISGIGKELVTVSADQPITAVAWVRKDQVNSLKTASGGWATAAPDETWITVEPHLQQFCRAFIRDRHGNEEALTQRLEQRLGLSPASSKTNFVRIKVEHPVADIFRPCSNPAPDQAGCGIGPPPKPQSEAQSEYLQWFYKQYYSSYGRSLISEFPWTALGYTFDWGPDPHQASAFERTGESEFVIRKGAPIEIIEVVTTMQYCAQ